MNEINLLPLYRVGIGEIKDGLLIKTHSFCSKKYNEKCEHFYKTIYMSQGSHQCPYGFTSYVFKCGQSNEIFTSFKLLKCYDKKKIKGKNDENLYNPVLTEDQLGDIIDAYLKSEKLKNDYNESTKFVKDIVHEIRNFNAQILIKSEELVFRIDSASKKKKNPINLELTRNIFELSSLISSRFSAYDATVNPESLKYGSLYPITVYKKFHKIKHCYDGEAAKKNIEIKMKGNSVKQINAYLTFDLLPYLLFDNAIKYSPSEREIVVSFEENRTGLKVMIESCGPYLEENELAKIFQKGYRGEACQKTNISGSGVGLFLAQKICEIHNIGIKVKSEATGFKSKSIDYGIFSVELNFSIL